MHQSRNYYIPEPSTATQRKQDISGRTESPVTRKSMTNSHYPQNLTILRPPRRQSENSRKLAQLSITSSQITEDGGIVPAVNHASLSPDQARLAYNSNLNDPLRSSNNVLCQPVGAGNKTSLENNSSSSTTRLKNIILRQVEQQLSHPFVFKGSSPGRTRRNSSRSASPSLAKSGGEVRNAARSINWEMDNSFQGSKGKTNSECVNLSALPSWRGQSVDTSTAIDEMFREFSRGCKPPSLRSKVGDQKVESTQKTGAFNLFNFMRRGKKKNGATGAAVKMTQSFYSSKEGVKADSDSFMVLNYTITTLRYKFEQANQTYNMAAEKIRELQAAAEACDEKCRLLTEQCDSLELQLIARQNGLCCMELEAEDHVLGKREINLPAAGQPPVARRFPSQDLTPKQFLKVLEDSKNSLRKLSSAICHHIWESGESATQVITSLLEQHMVGRWVRQFPGNVIILYFESFLNQVMFESFENISFEPNGASSVFDPDALKQTCYQLYQNLKNQEWSSIEKSLGKPGALVVNAHFHRFFVGRMDLILSQLGKLTHSEISLNLMGAFFNAAKSVWLVHHMAFAFDQPVSIFRVSPSAEFDPRFMEQTPAFKEQPAQSNISIMVNPGFIINDQTIKCQVLCSSKYR